MLVRAQCEVVGRIPELDLPRRAAYPDGLHLRGLTMAEALQGDAEVVSDVALGRAGLVKDLVVEPDAGLPVLVLPRLLRLRTRGGRGP